MEKYNHLLRPLRLGSIELKNRVGMSALTRNRALDTYPTELMKEYYLQRVRGGAGLIVTEGILVVRQGWVVVRHTRPVCQTAQDRMA